jgi:hypothetical protein
MRNRKNQEFVRVEEGADIKMGTKRGTYSRLLYMEMHRT